MRNRYLATLLLALPFMVAMVPAFADSTRTIDVALSHDAFSPERIEARRGEKIRLNVTSTDGAQGFQIKELGLDARIPAGARAVTLDFTPTEAGTFEITCGKYCGSGHGHINARLVVRAED